MVSVLTAFPVPQAEKPTEDDNTDAITAQAKAAPGTQEGGWGRGVLKEF